MEYDVVTTDLMLFDWEIRIKTDYISARMMDIIK